MPRERGEYITDIAHSKDCIENVAATNITTDLPAGLQGLDVPSRMLCALLQSGRPYYI